MKPTELLTGLPAHATHPPLTDVAIGLYSGAAVFAVLSVLGVSELQPRRPEAAATRSRPPRFVFV